MADRQFNFSAGPGVLPESVLREIASELPVYRDIGTSILEISHRSPAYTEVANNTRQHLRDLLGLGDDWHILFLQGGASMQFYQVPANFLPDGASADYVVTGAWAKKALKEAADVGDARTAASSADDSFSSYPDPSTWQRNPNAAYLHFTSNNTIYGTQLREDPVSEVPLVCDASSDFLSRPMNLDAYGLIYAGAQKNVGPAGVTLVLVRDSFLSTRKAGIPTMLDYGTHASKLFNTPPVFAVYAVEKVLRWLLELGGLPAIKQINTRKADKLYAEIDSGSFYRGTAAVPSRSQMNVCFRLPTEELEQKFIAEAAAAGFQALKGHRSVGGVRASLYNACPEEAVDALVSFMASFKRVNG